MAKAVDWSPEKIRYELNTRGWTFASVARAYGLSDNSVRQAARRPHFEAELAIAECLGLSPRQIWPSRYRTDGARHQPQPSRNYTDYPRFAASQKRSA